MARTSSQQYTFLKYLNEMARIAKDKNDPRKKEATDLYLEMWNKKDQKDGYEKDNLVYKAKQILGERPKDGDSR